MSESTAREQELARTHERFDAFHRRYDAAASNLPAYDAAEASDRERIAQHVRECLGVRESWIPEPAVEFVHVRADDGFDVHFVTAATWTDTCATAFVYQPKDAEKRGPWPLVLLACGHAKGGKHAPAYQQAARHLARRGAIVLCPDNIGQGERAAMGHRDVVGPFAAGISLQGMIVMETLGWLGWAQRELPVDANRLAAIGNSGGGTLTLLMIPFAPQLAAVASTGYPSSFHFIARKEKKHCHCNVLPGIARHLEMHHIYGCFAPRPLLLAQGSADHLFPPDLFFWNARHVRRTYQALGAPEHFRAHLMPGEHSWDERRIELIGDFLAEHLELEPAATDPRPGQESLITTDQTCLSAWPENALNADALASALTGTPLRPGLELWDVFPFDSHSHVPLPAVTERGDSRQILAQFQAFLAGR